MTHMHRAGRLAPQPDSVSFPHFLLESPKCRVGFGKYVIDFHINVGFSGEGASQVGERIGSFKWLVIHKRLWLVIHILLCRLLHDFWLLGAVGKTNVITRSRELQHIGDKQLYIAKRKTVYKWLSYDIKEEREEITETMVYRRLNAAFQRRAKKDN